MTTFPAEAHMSELQLPIGTAFDPMPEPTAYLKENRIAYCNPAFRRAMPDLAEGGTIPESWQALGDPATAALHWNAQSWTVLSWPWSGGILLRLTPVEDRPVLPNLRLPLLSQKLRGPVAALMSSGELLGRILTPLQEEQAEVGLARLNKAELRLLRLARTLELVALPDETPPYDFHLQMTDLNGLCHEAQRQLSALVEEVGCTLTFQDCDASLYVRCDDDLVLTLLYHLVSNALRAAGGQGHLELRLERRGQRAYISLLDDGPGMTPEQLSAVFAPDRGGDTLGEAMQGLGLGLTVCRKIAQLHEGGLLLSNRPGRGVCATFSLPLCQPGSLPSLESERIISSTGGVPLVLRELSDVLPERCFRPGDL